MSQCTKSEMLSLQVLLLEAVCCCLQTCVWFCHDDVPVYEVSLSENLVQASYRQKCKFYCLGLFVVVYKLVIVALTLEWHCVPVYQIS